MRLRVTLYVLRLSCFKYGKLWKVQKLSSANVMQNSLS